MKSESSAPGKIILFGEHFVIYGTKAILCAINRRITVRAETVPREMITIKSKLGTISHNPETKLADIDAPLRPIFHIASKLIKRHTHKGGMLITISSDIPHGVGLGSSSACCVAGASAILGLFKKHDREEILKLAIEAEKTIHRNSSGADCTVCLYGGVMEYSKNVGFAEINPAPEFTIVLANSDMKHSTGDVVDGVKGFREKNKARFEVMCKAEDHLVNDAILHIKNKDMIGLGVCVKKNQSMLKEIGVSNERLEEMIKIADSTSYGSKITGAGDGGCIFALNDDTNMQDTLYTLEKNGIECFSVGIDFKGLDTI
ncbi:MAG: mevalonate kinase [Thaumarchaeota archaeon]|nr:mevalonate kinase [Nitrososphaerota archaeon]